MVCGVCDARLVFGMMLWSHIRTEHLLLPSNSRNCPVCAQLLDTPELRTHLAQLHPSVHCYLCDKAFSSYKSYIGHCSMDKHKHQPEEKPKATCGLCKNVMSTGKVLMRHLLTCHLQQPSRTACRYCGQMLRILQLKAHLETDHPQVICLLCGV